MQISHVLIVAIYLFFYGRERREGRITEQQNRTQRRQPSCAGSGSGSEEGFSCELVLMLVLAVSIEDVIQACLLYIWLKCAGFALAEHFQASLVTVASAAALVSAT